MKYPTQAYDSWLLMGAEPDLNSEWECVTCRKWIPGEYDFCPNCCDDSADAPYDAADFVDDVAPIDFPEGFDGR